MDLIVADDQPAIRRIIARALEARGFSVLGVENGQRLIECWKKKPHAMVLCDVNMPGALDGIQACKEISGIDGKARIYMMTGDANSAVRVTDSGFPLAFRKPFTIEELESWASSL